VHDYFLQRAEKSVARPISVLKFGFRRVVRRKSLCNTTSSMGQRSRRSSREPGDEHEQFRLSGGHARPQRRLSVMQTERVGLVAEPAGRGSLPWRRQATRHSKQLTFPLTIDAGAIGVTAGTRRGDVLKTDSVFAAFILPYHPPIAFPAGSEGRSQASLTARSQCA
jgi:hypothetical protein